MAENSIKFKNFWKLPELPLYRPILNGLNFFFPFLIFNFFFKKNFGPNKYFVF